MEVFGFAVELWKWCPVLDLRLPGVGGSSGTRGSGGRFPVPDPLLPGRMGGGGNADGSLLLGGVGGVLPVPRTEPFAAWRGKLP